MKLETIDINKVITRSGKGYNLNFSDGRKEHFPSREAAERRERQIQYFKHKDKVSKGGPGSGRHKEQFSNRERKTIQRPSTPMVARKKPGIGRKLGHLLASSSGGAIRGGLLGSIAGPLGAKIGATAGGIHGGYRGIRNALRNTVPKRSAMSEVGNTLADVGVAYGLSRLPYRRMARAGRRMLRR